MKYSSDCYSEDFWVKYQFTAQRNEIYLPLTKQVKLPTEREKKKEVEFSWKCYAYLFYNMFAICQEIDGH